MTRLWDRGEALDDLVLRYTAGDDHLLDERLLAHDVRASIAHARMLHAQGHLSAEDLQALTPALESIAASHARGEWEISLEDEDCHTAIETRLTALVGEAGKRIHLGRSQRPGARGDPPLAEGCARVARGRCGGGRRRARCDRAGAGATPMPGYTHMQRAMPSTVALWAQAFASEIRDDAAGIRLRRGAQTGTPWAPQLDTACRCSRSIASTRRGASASRRPTSRSPRSSFPRQGRGVGAFEATLLAQDLGRLAADVCLFATAEVGFVVLAPELTTGSSMLPQKRNPDPFELVRGRTGEAAAALMECLAIAAKMPSGYHRDLQLLKKPLFRGMDGVAASSRVMARAVAGITFVEERLRAAMEPGLFAAERAYRLAVEEGVPFRDAYRRVRGDAGR
ncbi:MAG: lyase family protein [Acidobacteriota bacterium]